MYWAVAYFSVVLCFQIDLGKQRQVKVKPKPAEAKGQGEVGQGSDC